MGWADPAQPAGPDSAQWCWADFGPKWIGPISAQKTDILFWARPGPEGRAGPGSAWPINKTSWARTSLAQHKKPTGGIISPHPPACRTNVLHAEGNAGHGNNMRGKESLPGAEEAVAPVVLLLLEAVLWRRPVAHEQRQWFCCLNRTAMLFFSSFSLRF